MESILLPGGVECIDSFIPSNVKQHVLQNFHYRSTDFRKKSGLLYNQRPKYFNREKLKFTNRQKKYSLRFDLVLYDYD